MKKITATLLVFILCILTVVCSTPVAFAASYSGICGNGLTWQLDTLSGTLTISGSGEMEAYTAESMPEWNRYQGYIRSVVCTGGVTRIGAYAFYNGGNGYKYKKLTQVDLGDSVASIGAYAFRGCAAIETVRGASAVVTVEDYAFRSCTGLTEIALDNVQNIGNGAFSYCTALADFVLPNSVKTIGASAFLSCVSLQSVLLGTAVTSIGSRAFADCTGLVMVIYSTVSYQGNETSAFSGAGAVSGMQVIFADTVKIIPAGLFAFCENLTNVTLGNAVTTISDNAFRHTGLRTLHIPQTVTSVSGSAFNGCASLTQFTVDSGNPTFSAGSNGVLMNKSQSTIIRYPCGKTNQTYTISLPVTALAEGAFRECRNLEQVSIMSGVSMVSSYAFADCDNLQKVTLGGSVTSVGAYAFADCNALETLSMMRVTTIGSYGFFGCDSLYEVTMPSTLRTISSYAFANCKVLTNVTLNQGITTLDSYAFYCDRSIVGIQIPSTVTTIAEGAFAYCETLASVTISAGVTTIGPIAFLDCLALASVQVPSSVTTIGSYALGYRYINVYSPISGFTIYCEEGSAAYTYAQRISVFQVVTNSTNDIILDSVETDVNLNDTVQTVFTALEHIAAQTGFSGWIVPLQNLYSRVLDLFRVIKGWRG